MKAKKILLSIFIPIIAIICTVVLATGIAAFTVHCMARFYTDGSKVPVEEDGVSLSNWMSVIEDSTLMTTIAMPGSHDAGCKDMMWAYQTQNTSIADQLSVGTRYFDIRVANDGGNLRVFHADMLGDDFLPILDDIRAFLDENPSECLLLDFQHFFGGEAEVECKALTVSAIQLKLADYLIHNDTASDDLAFINSLRLGDCRGKCLVFWGRVDQYLENDWMFMRDDDDGTRANSVLHSYYKTEYNTNPSAKYIAEYLPEYWKQFDESNGGFFVLQGQLTDKLYVFGPASLEIKHDDNMNEYVLNLADDKVQKANIIMRDYVTAKKNIATISLNLRKGNVKSAYQTVLSSWL